MCGNDERNKLLKEEILEKSRIEQESRKKWNSDNLFKKKHNNFVEETGMTTMNEKWYNKIWVFVKKFLIK